MIRNDLAMEDVEKIVEEINRYIRIIKHTEQYRTNNEVAKWLNSAEDRLKLARNTLISIYRSCNRF